MSTLSTKIGSLPPRAGGRDREFVHHINEETRTKHKKENAKDSQLALLDFKPQEPIDYELFVTKNRTILSNDPHRELVLIPIDDLIGVKVERPRLQLGEPEPLASQSPESPSPSSTLPFSSSPSPPRGQLTERCLRGLASGWYEVAYRFAEYGAPCHVMLDSGLANGNAAGGTALEPLPYEVDLEAAATDEDAAAVDADESDSVGGGPSAEQMIKRFSLDTETSVAASRQRDQRPLLPLLPDLLPRRPWPVPLACESAIRPLPVRHEAATRLLITCVAFETELQAPDGNPEPFFLNLCLVDLSSECTLSERFYWCPPGAVGQLSQESFRVRDSAQPHPDKADARSGPPAGQASRSCVATLSRPAGPRVCLLVRVDKVVQGPPAACADRYAGRIDAKTGAAVQKSARPFCNHLSHYRQPFGWAFHPLFTEAGQLNPCPRSLALYRHDPAKAADSELMRCLREYGQRPERLANKFVQIPMRSFCITVQNMKDLPANRFNLYSSSLLPVAPDPNASAPPANAESALELEEFPVHDAEAALYAVPEPAFKHSLFVYPRQLNYDKCQGMFGRARNLSVFVELRDCDDELASAIRAVRARFRPDGVAWASWANTTVSYHDETPVFSEEIKLCLPLAISPRHHLFFKILHVSCDAAGKADKAKDRGGNLAKESKVGYAWLRLRDARSQLLSSGEVCLPVSVNLPTGYLDKPPQSSDLQWVDGGRPVFRVALRLASSVQTSEPCVQKFFMASEVALGCRQQQRDEEDVTGRLAVLAQTPRHIAIRFLIPLLGQLIRLIANSQCQDRLRVVAMTTAIHLVAACCDPNDLPERIQAADASANGSVPHAPAAVSAAGSANAAPSGGGGGSSGNLHERVAERTRRLFHAYVKFACLYDLLDGQPLHEELVSIAYETLKPGAADSLTLTRFLSSAWFFLGLLAKSMGESLVRTGRFKMSRSERFSDVFRYRVQNLVSVLASHIHSACRLDTRGLSDSLDSRPAGRANQALAVFLRRLLSMMDRGFAFQLVNQYCSTVRYGQLRIHFLDVLCQHEHYVPLNLPLVKHRLLKGGDAANSAAALGQHYDLRKRAVRCLRQLLCKHAIDCRYQSAPMRSRVAALYLPFVSLLVDQKHRLVAPAPAPAAAAIVAAKIAAAGVQPRRPPSDASFQASMVDGAGSLSGGVGGFRPASSASLMRQSAAAAGGGDIGGGGSGGSGVLSRKGSVISGHASQHGGASVDPDILNKIAGFESTLPRSGYVAKRPKSSTSGRASGSLRQNSATISEASTSSVVAPAGTADVASDRLSHGSDITIIDEEGSDDDGSRSLASSVSKAAGRSCASEPFRDKERRDLLLCLLHVVSCLEDEVLVSWLSSLSPNDRLDFLEILEIALETFRYNGKTKAKTFESISSSGALASKDRRQGIRGFRASKNLDEAD
uniref:C2 DOCK-type domain-containing protein n=1 Tax=Macrostomum lignano TaxID=282301 RepID=A0A1I8FYS7_9PLAT